MPVFFIRSTQVEYDKIAVGEPLFRHLSKSLRTRPGDLLIFNDEQGRRYHTKVLRITKQLIHSKILDVQERPTTSTPSIILAQAILKGEKMSWVIQKGTELGIQTFAPLITERVIPRVSSTHTLSYQERWERIALEAAQQSERWTVPKILPSQPIEKFLQQAKTEMTIFLVERQEKISLSNIPLPLEAHGEITVVIGPEGGWTKEEVEKAEAHKCSFSTLGQGILRAETASLAAVAILQSRLQYL